MKLAEMGIYDLTTERTAGARRCRFLATVRAILVLMALAGPVLAGTAAWTPLPNIAEGGYAPTATVLSASADSGKVLAAGGYNGSAAVSSAQLFDPNTNTWSTTGSLKTGRAFHTATTFDDGTGRVLIAGGFKSTFYGWVTQASAEIYNPATRAFSYVTRTVNRKSVQVSMNQARELFTATRLLPDPVTGLSKVLLVGGIYGGQTTLRSAEIFDPATMTFTYTTGQMQTPNGRHEHDAVFIPPDAQGGQGKVLVVGGKDHNPSTGVWSTLKDAELYDVASGTFESITMLHPRTRPRVVWVPSAPRPGGGQGMALVVGGKYAEAPKGYRDALASEWFDPTSKTFIEGPSLQQGRMAHTLTALGDGGVSFLAAGGWSETLGRSTETAELFRLDLNDPVYHGSFNPLGYPESTMQDPRQDHAAVTLPNFRVLVVGGKPNVGGTDTYLNHAEYYTLP